MKKLVGTLFGTLFPSPLQLSNHPCFNENKQYVFDEYHLANVRLIYVLIELFLDKI